MKKAQWENWVNLALGIWLFITPWLVSHNLSASLTTTMDWSCWAVGTVVAVTAALALWDLQPWEEWVNMALGAYIFLSPTLLGYSGEQALMWNSIIAGLAIAVFAGLAIPVAQKLQQQHN